MGAFVYMLRCADGSYYVGTATGDDLTRRIAEHNSGAYPGYTSTAFENAVAGALNDEQVIRRHPLPCDSGPSPFEARPSVLAPQGDGIEIFQGDG